MELLEILRYLNKDNINNEPKLRDELFKKLMICDENVSDYVPTLSDAYYEEFRKQYEGNVAINYLLSEIFCKEIERQLTYDTMEVDRNYIKIPAQSSAYVVTYVGSVKGMKKIIEQAPQHFDFFKERILMGLITRYCKEDVDLLTHVSGRLSKVVGIYAEHIRHLDIFKPIPTIIDQEFIDELKKLPYIDSKECWRAVHKLIDRALPKKIEKSYYQVQEEFINSPYQGPSKKR